MKEREIVGFYTSMINPWSEEKIADYCQLHQMPLVPEDRIKYHLLSDFTTKNPGFFGNEDMKTLMGLVITTKERLEKEGSRIK